jgi:hypothetical protein
MWPTKMPNDEYSSACGDSGSFAHSMRVGEGVNIFLPFFSIKKKYGKFYIILEKYGNFQNCVLWA